MVCAVSPLPSVQFDLQSIAIAIAIPTSSSPRHRTESFTLPKSAPSILGPSVVLPHTQHHHHQHRHRHRHLHGGVAHLCSQGDLGSAMEALLQSPAQPTEDLYLLLLKACGRTKDKARAKAVFFHIREHSAQASGLLRDYLVVTLAKCGALDEAIQAWNRLDRGTLYSYTAMISCYHDHGLDREAFDMYESMQRDGIEPDRHTFASLIRICASSRDLRRGRELHEEADRRGLASDAFVGNSLVSMYGKCRSIGEAEHAFVAIAERNPASWTSMMAAYAEIGQFKKTLRSFRQMLEENAIPNQHTFGVALQACYGLCKHIASSKPAFLDIAHALHAEIHRHGLGSNIFVATSLMNLYGKCGRIEDAENLFTRLPQHDIASWNAMLCSYIEQGWGASALRLYKHMQERGISPDQKTAVMALQACVLLAKEEEALLVEGRSTRIMSTECFRAIHRDAERQAFAANAFFGTTLLGLYGKNGMITEAESIFCELPKRDVVSWTAMLTAYLEQGQGANAIRLYRQMQEEGIDGNEQTYVVAIQACGVLIEEKDDAVAAMEIGRALHADARRKGFDSNLYAATSLLGMYAACGNIAEAENVFDSLPQRDVAAWNAMLTGYVDRGRGHEALQLYSEMLEAGMNPNQKTFVVILHACTILVAKEPDAEKTALFDLASAIHADLRRWGFEGNVFIGNTLVSIYGKLGKLVQAEDVFARMLRHETISWNAMLSAYVERNEGEAALELYGRMRQENAITNDVTHLCLLQACGAIGSLEVCHEIHFSMVSAGYDHNAPLLATLIHTYGSCSSMEDAASLFQAVLRPDIVSWNAYIAGHAGVGSYDESARLLDEMHRQGIEPDGITLASVLSACSHGGLVDQGLDHFEDLCTRFGITPDLKHYSTVIDLLGRAGGLTMLEDLLARMPVEADLSIWLPLLGACRLHGNADLGKQAFANAVDLKPTRASAYVIMSNIYADLELKAEDA